MLRFLCLSAAARRCPLSPLNGWGSARAVHGQGRPERRPVRISLTERRVLLLLIAYIVDADYIPRTRFDWLVGRGVRHAQNGNVSVIRLALLDGFKCWASQNCTNCPPGAIGFWHIRSDADVFIASLYKQRGGHAFSIFLSDG